MEQNFKIIPFSLEKAKTPSNPNGLEVVTRKGNDVKIICNDYRGLYGALIIGLVQYNDEDYETCYNFYADGHYKKVEDDDIDLFLKEPIKLRRMTHQELSWWLREHPEEYREWTYSNGVSISSNYAYDKKLADKEVNETILIRSNGGEWKEPLIEVKEGEL